MYIEKKQTKPGVEPYESAVLEVFRLQNDVIITSGCEYLPPCNCDMQDICGCDRAYR